MVPHYKKYTWDRTPQEWLDAGWEDKQFGLVPRYHEDFYLIGYRACAEANAAVAYKNFTTTMRQFSVLEPEVTIADF